MEPLKPCPFCGGGVKYFKPGAKGASGWLVQCRECDYELPSADAAFQVPKTKAEVTRLWNRRATPDEYEEVVMSINQVTISGNLTRDAELKTEKVLKFTVAVAERRKIEDVWQDVPNFIDCVVFGNRATGLQPYLKKGVKVCVSGSLRQEKWNKDGETRTAIQVVANDVELMYKSRTEATKEVYDEEVPF